MAVQEDDLGSEQTLKKILQTTNAIWENVSGTTKDTIILPGSCTDQRTHIRTSHFKDIGVTCVLELYVQ